MTTPLFLTHTENFSSLTNTPPRPPSPFLDLTHLLPSHSNFDTLGTSLRKSLPNILKTPDCVTDFRAANKKHADCICLHDETKPLPFKECRQNRGSSVQWKHNENAKELPDLVKFVSSLVPAIFSSTGKVQVISSPADTLGAEHVDHKFVDLVSEFIWVSVPQGEPKRFYIRDANNDKRYVQSSTDTKGIAGFFDDHHAHSADPSPEHTYSIRIDGVFSKDARARIADTGVFAEPEYAAVLRNQAQNQPAADQLADDDPVAALKTALAVANARIAELEAPPVVPPTYHSPAWSALTLPLYSTVMGCENMGPLLYSLIRFAKPRKVVEVGAGFTTIHILQALRDNDEEMDQFRSENNASNDPDSADKWPFLNWANEKYLEDTGGYSRSVLHCIDNMHHKFTTARKVAEIAEVLGVEDALAFVEGDALDAETVEDLYGDVGGEGRVNLLWLDFTDGDMLDDVLLQKGYWDLLDPNGGLLLIHSTLTNTASRAWLERMKQPQAQEDYGPFELIGLLEPHKMRQNSCTCIRRKGASLSEAYEEPIFTAFA